MEWPWKQFELWPRTMSPEELEELNEELNKSARSGKRKGEDLVSEEDAGKARQIVEKAREGRYER